MPRTTINTHTGTICYRTALMPLALAANFAKCLQANQTRFSDVEITPSQRAKGEKYFVTFRPARDARQSALYQSEWDRNQARADAEGEDFLYFKNPDNPAVTFVFNPKSGETWEMFNGHCQCPHKLFRLTNAALSCKHELEKERRMRLGIPLDGSDKVLRVARNERCLLNREKDF